MIGCKDEEVVQYALSNNLIILTHDLDYGRIVTLSGLDKPSVITFRNQKINRDILFHHISTNFNTLKSYLDKGALISIDEEKIRCRTLPIAKRN